MEKDETYLLDVDNPMVIPINTKVRFLLTSNDVIHAWWVPDFAVKRDAVPGFINETWAIVEEPGIYRGQCAELCGKEHAYMPIHVKVLSHDDYSAWVAVKQKEMAALADDPNKVWTLEDLVARGEKVYAANCVACHQASGKGAGPIKPLDGAAVVLGLLTVRLSGHFLPLGTIAWGLALYYLFGTLEIACSGYRGWPYGWQSLMTATIERNPAFVAP